MEHSTEFMCCRYSFVFSSRIRLIKDQGDGHMKSMIRVRNEIGAENRLRVRCIQPNYYDTLRISRLSQNHSRDEEKTLDCNKHSGHITDGGSSP